MGASSSRAAAAAPAGGNPARESQGKAVRGVSRVGGKSSSRRADAEEGLARTRVGKSGNLGAEVLAAAMVAGRPENGEEETVARGAARTGAGAATASAGTIEMEAATGHRVGPGAGIPEGIKAGEATVRITGAGTASGAGGRPGIRGRSFRAYQPA